MNALLLALLLGAGSGAPTVQLSAPNGGWTTQRIVHVTGTVSDDSIPLATLVVNGGERPLKLNGGAFDVQIVLTPGLNVVEVVATNAGGTGRAKRSFIARVPKLDVRVVLSWDTDQTDVDLHVAEPDGQEAWYGHRETPSGGNLDIDVVDGFGPEIYTQSSAQPGQYVVWVSYFSDHGHAQSQVTCDVVLFEGTEREQRLRFTSMLTRTGNRFEVGRFMVKARSAAP